MNLNAVETRITVGGAPCDFICMNLDQYVAGHHTFEIAVSHRHEKQSVWALTVDDIFRQTLNQPVHIRMSHTESGEVNEFEGVVTDIEAVGVDGDKGTVILRGGSPTLLLDRDPAMDAFVDYTLHNVVAETIENTGINVAVDNKPKLQRMIPYIARYDESSYAFLSRVLSAFGEWFYYDGKKLVVGNPMNQRERKVTFDLELLEVRSAAGLRNLNVRYYDYNAEDNNYFEEAAGTISNANLPMKGAKMIADPLFPTPAKRPVGRAVLGETDITAVVRTKQNREYTQTSIFTARCNTCGIRIGEVATVQLPDFDDVRFKDLGSFRVIEVHHRINKDGHYENEFKGITALTETLPDHHVVMPRAFQEPALVTDNEDPEGKGRVKVRFFWQPESKSTNWIQVQTPDAGLSDKVPENRGFFFVPEVDDQVLVGFMHGDPGRPYVMGSLFHRKNTKGAAPDNHIKTISTKSGHTIEFNDDQGEDWGITIKDKGGNVVRLDTHGKSIEISAPETVTLTAKNMYLRASENISLSSGKDTVQSVGGDFFQNVSGRSQSVVDKTHDLTVKKEASLTVGSHLTQAITGKFEQGAESVNIQTTGGPVDILAPDTITVKSSTKVIIAQ